MSFWHIFAVRLCLCTAFAVAVSGCTPKDGVREFEQAKAAFDLHDLKRAEALFEKSLGYAPGNVEALVYLARVKLGLGQLPAAAKCLTAAQETEDGEAGTDIRILSAQLAWHGKDYEKASRIYSGLANDTRLGASVRAEALAGLGVVEMTCDRHHAARIAFLRALRLDRRNASAWYHLGLLYRDGFGYLDAALEQFEIYVRLDDAADRRVQNVQRSVIPGLKDRIAQNAANRPGVSKRDSTACSTLLAQAEAAWKKGDFKKSRQLYQNALTADPLSYPSALGLAKAWEKTNTAKEGRQMAFENYKLACILNPSAISTYVATGSRAMTLGRYADAVEIFSRAVAASPTSFAALDGLVGALRKVGNKGKIAQAYQLYRESIPVRKQ